MRLLVDVRKDGPNITPVKAKKGNTRMASFDGFDEFCEPFCGPCESDEVRNEAKYYCLNCEQNICDACRDSHRKIPILRGHKILHRQMNQNLFSSVSRGCFYVNCKCQQGKEVKYYCEDENLVICASCNTLDHRKCRTTLIEEKSASFTQTSLDRIIDKQNSLKKRLEQLLQNRRIDYSKIKKTQSKCVQDIKAFRRELDMLFDTLQDDMLKDLDRYAVTQVSSADEHIETLTETLQVLSLDENLLKQAKQQGQKETMYAAHVQVSNMLPKYESLIADMKKAVQGCYFSFNQNKDLTDMKGRIKTFGSIRGKELFASSQTSDAPIKSRLKIESLRLLYIKQEDDRVAPSVVGSAFMRDRYVLLSDNANRKLKLLDTEYEIITNSLKLEDRPCDLSVIDESNAVVTIPNRRQVQFVQVFPRLRLSRVTELDKKCYGVVVHGSEIYVSCHNRPGDGEIRVIDSKNNSVRKLVVSNERFQFLGPHYLTIDKTGKSLYVSDWDESVVTCMTTNGDTIYQYTDTTLKGPEAIFVDSSGSVFVCNSGAHNVQIITADGRKGSVLLSTSDCLSQPKSIAFREGDSTLILGCLLQEHLLYFKLADS